MAEAEPAQDPAVRAELRACLATLRRLQDTLRQAPPANWTNARLLESLAALGAADEAASRWLDDLAP